MWRKYVRIRKIAVLEHMKGTRPILSGQRGATPERGGCHSIGSSLITTDLPNNGTACLL